jgi:hypothetical protein
VRERLVDDLLPTIFFGDLGLQRHMWRNANVGDILRSLERRYFWSRVHYPMANPIKEPILEKLI